MRKIYELIEVLDNLARMPRSGGTLFSGMDISKGESLAEHSYKVVWLTYILSKIAQKNNIKLNVENLLIYSTIHDWNESVLLDIPTGSPSYQSYFDENIRDIVHRAEKKVIKQMNDYVADEARLDLEEIQLTDVEKEIMITADNVAYLVEILNWKFQGYKYDWFDYVWYNTINRTRKTVSINLKFLEPLLDELQESYIKGSKPTNPFLTKKEYQTFKGKE